MVERCEVCGAELFLVGEKDKGRCVDHYSDIEIQGFTGCKDDRMRKLLAMAEVYNVIKSLGKVETYINGFI